MAEIDSLNASYYYSGVQNASNEKIKRNTKKEEIQKAGRTSKFEELLKEKEEVSAQFVTEGLPPEVAKMSIDDAAVYLADAVSMAGNNFSEEQTQENLENFKRSVGQFIRFIVSNNFDVSAHRRKNRVGKEMMSASRTMFFSDYTIPPHKENPRYKINIINEKLDALAQETLSSQMNNLKILAQVNEIKGLIVDLMSA